MTARRKLARFAWRFVVACVATILASHLAELLVRHLVVDLGWNAYTVVQHLGAFELLICWAGACFVLRAKPPRPTLSGVHHD